MEFLLVNENLGDYDVGDIIDIHPDGFVWGTSERNNPRFQLVRIPDEEVGSLETLRTSYLAPSISFCSLCNKYVVSADINAHLEEVHEDVLYDVLINPPRRKSAEEVGVVLSKRRRWNIDSQSSEICEKVLTNSDTELTQTTRLTVTLTVL